MMSCPHNVTLPLVGIMPPVMMFMHVDLPAPFGPSSPKRPLSISREIPRNAGTGPGKTL